MSDLKSNLRDGIAFLIALLDDLENGRAKEVLAPGHVYQHLLKAELAESVFTSSGEEIAMVRHEQCVDFMKLCGVWMYIATCPKTGIRFVESN